MKTVKLFAISLFVIASAFSPFTAGAQSSETPVRTAFIKHPGAEDAKTFFASNTNFLFEVYKVGSKEDIGKILSAFGKDAAVENISQGVVTGDYTAFSLSLKSAKDKDWFVKTFKKAGLNTIHLNNHPTVPVEKM
ncbi:MAG: hypothetical protein PSX36_13105 [bacterium]|nr:hypothetical protein [bacterium]